MRIADAQAHLWSGGKPANFRQPRVPWTKQPGMGRTLHAVSALSG